MAKNCQINHIISLITVPLYYFASDAPVNDGIKVSAWWLDPTAADRCGKNTHNYAIANVHENVISVIDMTAVGNSAHT